MTKVPHITFMSPGILPSWLSAVVAIVGATGADGGHRRRRRCRGEYG